MVINNEYDERNFRLSKALEKSKDNLDEFVPIYEAYVERIYTYCRHRVHSPQDAEDLTSQVFARAMERCRTYRGGNVGAWLFQIAYHITMDYFRTPKLTVLSEDLLDRMSDHSQRQPLDVLLYKERLEMLSRYLDTLSEGRRNLLLLRITGELSAAEIGEIVGKRDTAVRVEIHRIIQELKQLALQDT
jgi:RNA polymerase sigma-70 factor, ECF subfamily